jgi:hypothetical protein
VLAQQPGCGISLFIGDANVRSHQANLTQSCAQLV